MTKIKLKKNGFTLVELLSVIVILAIIAAIAIPNVLNIIENSKKNAFLINVEMVLKAIEENMISNGYEEDKIHYLSDLNVNSFSKESQGYWFYDKVNKVVIIPVASSSNGRYHVNQVSNKRAAGYTMIDDAKVVSVGQANLLSTRINGAFSNCPTPPGSGDYNPNACIVTAAEGSDNNVIGYIRGPQAGVNNYVQFAGTDWRIVKVNNNGTILMVRDDLLKNDGSSVSITYDGTSDICFSGFYSWNGICSNNFANSDIKVYLNNDFYNTLTDAQKGMLVSNNWDTKCTNGGANPTYGTCPDNGPTTTISKVGLLTHYDYVVGAKSNKSTDDGYGYNSYLNKTSFIDEGIWYWLGTGQRNSASQAWDVDDFGYVNPTGVFSYPMVRPAVILKASTELNCTVGDGAGQCNGSLAKPYLIK